MMRASLLQLKKRIGTLRFGVYAAVFAASFAAGEVRDYRELHNMPEQAPPKCRLGDFRCMDKDDLEQWRMNLDREYYLRSQEGEEQEEDELKAPESSREKPIDFLQMMRDEVAGRQEII